MGQIQQQLTGTSSPSLNVLVGPSLFDRYPQMLHAREHSSGSLASNFAQQQRPLRQSQSDSPGSSTQNLIDPFSQNAELSPFGGYPASQFPLHIDEKEEDDFLHNPDPIADAAYDKNRFLYDMKHMDRRSFFGLVGYVLILLAAAAVFIVLPVVTYSGSASQSKPESYEVLTQFSYPLSSAIRTSLIDPDTPSANLTKTTRTGEEWVLTFSDEFNAEGRTFYDGDDQFFQGVDIHYDATKDLEWYDPDAVTTANGTLVLRMDAYENHDLYYRSGMVQSWNKLCFLQGMIVVSALLPGYGNISGLWPGLWTLGNLGRPGYLGTTEGVWPYTYDSCDSGITANQSSPDGISYLPGQKLNVCTCPGESHPNTGVGRGSPEIDIVEGSVDSILKVGVVSQSYQVAPMDIWYMPDYNFVEIYNHEVTAMNTYAGGPFQQAVSILSTLNTTWYTDGDYSGNFQDYGFEYLNDNDDGYITLYVGQDPVVTVNAYALGPNGNIGFRRISKEPMSLIMNLGISNNWAYIDWPALRFPLLMRVDYVRIYQPADSILMTCDPEGYPTTEYISNHGNVYNNVNLTSWEDAGYTFPKNRLVHGC
ncbi:beta-glucan synthesis-associated [Metschnikowia bicuspidata var. bicuspidata NRRL YB-4993]|uniref:Beta-glucan synthesis-associated n=1 Tax=Metschnikowia bicuspidata var. bicuspidata NRRL YB-4993 TaxID=869754 RepID=A0A1A0HJB0_9ASCO|nr:beta-glucan synthesis-associated [Metschnikowia bicuspidata var. bicuspidata NRRL YB-4993]OBA24244.1 beta-glucan synthesis-associated [Metschnikowia bicuspidata var. bicuspidata NRRL YB-4993]